METMSGLDAKFVYSETPTAHMHTIKAVSYTHLTLPTIYSV